MAVLGALYKYFLSLFVNADLTPAEVKAAYDRRQILRQKRSAAQNKNTSAMLEPRQSGFINVNNTFKQMSSTIW